MKKSIYFFSADKIVNALKRKNLKALVKEIFENEKTELQNVKFIFCSDKYLLKINRNYLKHNFYTDVITFGLSKFNEPVSGEIYLSVDRIKQNAKSYLVSYQNELLRVMIHGALHLCGYKDNSATAKKQMRKKENYYLKLYFNQYVEK